jgi:hypothetical protein
MQNPYQSPTHANAIIPVSFQQIPVCAAIILSVSAIVTSLVSLPPLFANPIRMWGWKNWLLFTPVAYLIFGAFFALMAETRTLRRLRVFLPIVLLPLFLFTFLVYLSIYADLTNLLARNYSASQISFTAAIVLLCFVIDWYFVFAVLRSRILFRHPFHKRDEP